MWRSWKSVWVITTQFFFWFLGQLTSQFKFLCFILDWGNCKLWDIYTWVIMVSEWGFILCVHFAWKQCWTDSLLGVSGGVSGGQEHLNPRAQWSRRLSAGGPRRNTRPRKAESPPPEPEVSAQKRDSVMTRSKERKSAAEVYSLEQIHTLRLMCRNSGWSRALTPLCWKILN